MPTIKLDKKFDLSDAGSIDTLIDQYGEPYKYRTRSVKAKGHYYFDNLVIKVYIMIRDAEPFSYELEESLDDFIKVEIGKGYMNMHQGVGFAILSQGFLSINMWGRGNVLFTYTYTIEKYGNKLRREPLEKTGVACTWEAKIMNHEYDLWHQFLQTNMSEKDKRYYLETFIEGSLK